MGKVVLKGRAVSGKPLGKETIAHYYTTLSRFFSDVTRRAHAVSGAPARKIKLDFNPKEVFALPDQLKRDLDRVDPRAIDLRVWAKLTIAAATLSQGDLTVHPRYPLSLYRALGVLWVTSARRPNELVRLRLDCTREEWEPESLDEHGLPLEKQALA